MEGRIFSAFNLLVPSLFSVQEPCEDRGDNIEVAGGHHLHRKAIFKSVPRLQPVLPVHSLFLEHLLRLSVSSSQVVALPSTAILFVNCFSDWLVLQHFNTFLWCPHCWYWGQSPGYMLHKHSAWATPPARGSLSLSRLIVWFCSSWAGQG